MLSSAPFECPSGLLVHAQQHLPLKTAVVNAETETVMTSAKLATEHNLIEPILVGDAGAINQMQLKIICVQNKSIVDRSSK